jgi:hypothetical protein
LLWLVSIASAAGADRFTIVFRVYDGPMDDATQPFTYRDVELVPGSPEADEFVANQRRANPGLVRTYEMLTSDQRLRDRVGEILAIDGVTKKVILTDDTLKYIDSDKDGKPDEDAAARAVTHVWPHSAGSYVMISQSYLGSYPTDTTVAGLLIHELSHTQDHTALQHGDYGPDGRHGGNEILYNQQLGKYAENAAWIEGWAQFNPLLYEPARREQMVRDAESLAQDATTTAGPSSRKSWKDATYEERAAVEIIPALIMADIARLLPNGEDKLYASFQRTNGPSRTLRDVLRDYVSHNPSEAFVVAAIYDAYTGFAASDAILDDILGADLGARYRKDFRDDLRARNKTGTVAGAQEVVAHSASHLLESSVQARLEAVNARVLQLESARPSIWDFVGGPGVLLIRKFLNDREKAKLLAERQVLEADLNRLRSPAVPAQPQSVAQGLPRTGTQPQLILPAPALVGELPTPPGWTFGTANLRSMSGNGQSSAPAVIQATPARSYEGQPVSWGR